MKIFVFKSLCLSFDEIYRFFKIINYLGKYLVLKVKIIDSIVEKIQKKFVFMLKIIFKFHVLRTMHY